MTETPEWIVERVVRLLSPHLHDGIEFDDLSANYRQYTLELAAEVIAAMQPPPAATTEPAPGTVRVRAAVAVNRRGEYDVAGWHRIGWPRDDAAVEAMVRRDVPEDHPIAVTWIRVDLPIPTTFEVVASAEDGDA